LIRVTVTAVIDGTDAILILRLVEFFAILHVAESAIEKLNEVDSTIVRAFLRLLHETVKGDYYMVSNLFEI